MSRLGTALVVALTLAGCARGERRAAESGAQDDETWSAVSEDAPAEEGRFASAAERTRAMEERAAELEAAPRPGDGSGRSRRRRSASAPTRSSSAAGSSCNEMADDRRLLDDGEDAWGPPPP
jgi:hypothetical protein